MKFNKKLKRIQEDRNSLVCVGLDSDYFQLPERFIKFRWPQFEFNKWIINQTHQYVCAYKPNFAFYESRGASGWKELQMTMDYLTTEHPDIVTVADAKRGDVGSTNGAYVRAIFDELKFDAVTLHPYVGKEALEPFMRREEKLVFILCRTSNPGAGEIQDLKVQGYKLWELVAKKVVDDWNDKGNCGLVVGATYPAELKKVRQIAGEVVLLVPGVGAQGGEIKKIVEVGLDKDRRGMIINSSRGIIFAENPCREVIKLRDKINRYRR